MRPTASDFLRRHFARCIALVLLVAVAAPVVALNVQPVIVDLQTTGRRTSAIITLQNTFAETVPAEVTVHPVRVVDGELKEFESEEVDDILVFPAQASLGPNQSQAFRIQWIGDPELNESRHFYVTVAQLPVAFPENQNTIQVLHRFKVLVSVGAASQSSILNVDSAEIVTDADGVSRPVLTVSNSGKSYGYVANNRMTVIQRDNAGAEIFRQTFEPDEIRQRMGLGLIPSGQLRRLPVGVDLPQPAGNVTVELSPAENG